MDFRWTPLSRDSKREVKVILHPTATMAEVRRGFDSGSDDSIDLSEFVKDISQSAFDLNVTLAFNRELFGDYQPKPNQILEVQLLQTGKWQTLWMGVLDAINSFTLQRGERSMQLIAKTRDQQDIWRNTKRVTPLFPIMTNLHYIATRIARSAGMDGDEIMLPPTSISTRHANTQMADMNAWDMVESIFTACGWTPFIDSLGRLRAADRSLQIRTASQILSDDRMIKVGGQRQRAPSTRVRVMWLDPTLKKNYQASRILTTVSVTLGWWLPSHTEKVTWSEDGSLRADATKIVANPGVDQWVKWTKAEWTQQSPVKGKIHFNNAANFTAMAASIATWLAAHKIFDTHIHTHTVAALGGGVTGPPVPPQVTPVGRIVEGIAMAATMALMMNAGTGLYEVWGKPYEWIHARNISEAFDSSVPKWVDNTMDIESDWIINESHGKAVAIRELIYQARSANKWSVTIVDDPRIEYGDILQFPDGSQLFVEDYHRSLSRGDEATLDIQGFLIGPARGAGKMVTVVGGLPGEGDTGGTGTPGGPGGGPGHEDPNVPDPGDGSPGSSSANPIVAMSMSTIAADVQASLDWYIANMGRASNNNPGYWIDKASTPEKFSNLKWYAGWNKYWEDRMAPGNNGSADPGGGNVPSVHR